MKTKKRKQARESFVFDQLSEAGKEISRKWFLELRAVLAKQEPALARHERLHTHAYEMLEALKGVAIMLNTELRRYDGEPWAQRVRAVIAKIEDFTCAAEAPGTADTGQGPPD